MSKVKVLIHLLKKKIQGKCMRKQDEQKKFEKPTFLFFLFFFRAEHERKTYFSLWF